MEGKQYEHTNGNIYTVLFLTNTNGDPERQEYHPVDVVYRGRNGSLWSRPLSDWSRSFTEIIINN